MHIVHGSGLGADEGGHQEDDEDGVADVLPQEFGAHDAEQGQEEDQDRHLKADAEPEDDREEEAGVVLDGDHGREIVPNPMMRILMAPGST